MTPELRQGVWDRAAARCEHCHMPSEFDDSEFEIDHVIALFHDGRSVLSNLALLCYWCNHFKGTNLSGIDPATKRITNLFNPRRNRWAKHFRWDGPVLVGRTDIGRTTVSTLRINRAFRVAPRRILMAEGVFPLD